MAPGRRRLIFLSHATADIELASYIEDTIRGSIPSTDIFRTSRPGQMPVGQGWFQQITDALYRADAFIVLITPSSQDRWWVLFEAGAALRSKKTFLPVVAGGLVADSVNEPLKFLTLLFLKHPEQAKQALAELGGSLVAPTEFSGRVTDLADRGRRAAAKRDAWQFVEHPTGIYAWDGPLPSLPEGVAVPQPDDLLGLLANSGLETTHGFLSDAVEGARGFSPVYLVKNWSQKHRVMRQDRQVLWVKARHQ